MFIELFLAGSFMFGYGVAYIRQRYNDQEFQTINNDISNTSLNDLDDSYLDLDPIYDAIENMDDGEWYLQQDGTSNVWQIWSRQEDGFSTKIFPEIDGNPKPKILNFIANSKNEYIPELLSEIERIKNNQNIVREYIETALLDAKHTAEDYKKILDNLLTVL